MTRREDTDTGERDGENMVRGDTDRGRREGWREHDKRREDTDRGERDGESVMREENTRVQGLARDFSEGC